jgi:hypothetical protein
MRKTTILISASLLALALSTPAAALDSKGAAGRTAGAAAGVGGKAGLGSAIEVADQGKPARHHRSEGKGLYFTGASHTRVSKRLSPSTYGLLAARDPALFAFRNCIASYSAREVGNDVSLTWGFVLFRATEGECRARFDDMAQMLSKRFGEKRVESVMQQLIETTLLPAAKARGKPDGQALPMKVKALNPSDPAPPSRTP